MDTSITKYTILPLIGLQNNREIWIEGHIIKINQKLLVIKDREKYWRNIFRVINSYMPGSINGRKLEISFNGKAYHVHTNKRGLVRLTIPLENSKKINHHDFNFFLIKKGEKLKIELSEPFIHYYFSEEKPALGIISDVDDTVLVTHTKNPIRRMRTLLVKNAFKRKIVKQMKDLYHHFSSRGYSFFYVSNSEANLFPMIRLFLEHQGLPIGPLFLKSFRKWKSLFKSRRIREKGYHKKEKIQMLMDVFPNMKFILIGDDSQQDPEIYTYFAQQYPDRIQKILIRNISRKVSKRRLENKKKLAEENDVALTYFKNPADLLNE